MRPNNAEYLGDVLTDFSQYTAENQLPKDTSLLGRLRSWFDKAVYSLIDTPIYPGNRTAFLRMRRYEAMMEILGSRLTDRTRGLAGRLQNAITIRSTTHIQFEQSNSRYR